MSTIRWIEEDVFLRITLVVLFVIIVLSLALLIKRISGG